MATKIPVYIRDERHFDINETHKRYSFAPLEADRVLYGDTDLMSVSMDDSKLHGYFYPADGVVAEVAESNSGDILLYVDNQPYEADWVVKGTPALNGHGKYRKV